MPGLHHPWPHWAAQGSNTVDGPKLVHVAILALAVWLAVNVLSVPLLFPPATYRGPAAGVRVVSPACAEAARLRSHGATASPQYDRLRVACSRSTQRP
jgi:hypothetical protein